METIHGYHFDKSEAHNSPNGSWYKAESDGKVYFLKKFLNPKFPREGSSPETYAAKKKECDEWLAAKKKLIKALDELGNGTGNIISPRDVFREKLSFFQATYWIDVQTDSLDQIKNYSPENKVMLLRTYAAALKKVHSKGIIHGDLKPENILIGKSATGKPVAKLIDFDDSYFSQQALPPDLTVVTDAYQSPELAAYKLGHVEYRERLTCSSDVFATGIIFHQFWCGETPDYPGKNDGKFLFEAVASGQSVQLDKSLPEWLQNLIHAMLMPLPEDRPTMEEVHAATSDQKFERAVSRPEAPKPAPAEVNYAELDKLWARIPEDLSGYTDESVSTLMRACDRISGVRAGADQATVDKCVKVLYAALKNLQKKVVAPVRADYSRVDKILSVIPKDLSGYTEESAGRLRKMVRYVATKRNLTSQQEVDKLAKMLYATYVGLVPEEEQDTDAYSIRPASPLPAGYSKVKILSEEKVCVYLTNGSKMTISRVAALSMKLIVLK